MANKIYDLIKEIFSILKKCRKLNKVTKDWKEYYTESGAFGQKITDLEHATHYCNKLNVSLYNNSSITKSIRDITVLYYQGNKLVFEEKPLVKDNQKLPINLQPDNSVELYLVTSVSDFLNNKELLDNVDKISFDFLVGKKHQKLSQKRNVVNE